MDFTERISTYDHRGPESGFQVASIAFLANDLQRTYCVGYRYLGGGLKTSANWEYHHANTRQSMQAVQESINKKEIEQILHEYEMSIDGLLNLYCQLIEPV